MSAHGVSDLLAATSLLGRRVRGYYTTRNPKYVDYGKVGYDKDVACWIDVIAEGEIVAVSSYEDSLRLWTLDAECMIRKIKGENAVVLPRDHTGALR